jgi:hypothetical protein
MTALYGSREQHECVESEDHPAKDGQLAGGPRP